MIVEGRGHVAPSPVVVFVQRHEMLVILTEATKQAERRQYKSGSTVWSQGLKGDVVIEGVGLLRREIRPIFCGMMGEYATCCHINRRFGVELAACDFVPRRFGDGGVDLSLFSVAMQIKTREKPTHGNLIRRIDERGKTLPLTANAFVFCEWRGFDSVQLLGWDWTRNFVGKPLEPAIVGGHQNIVVPDDELQPMSRLIDNLEAHREWGQ